MRINKWNDEDLDIAAAGWILESNPTIHHHQYIYKLMKTYCKSFNRTFHPVELQSKTISFTNRNTKIKTSSQAIHILCRCTDITQVQDMMQTMYTDKEFHGPGKFIPVDTVANSSRCKNPTLTTIVLLPSLECPSNLTISSLKTTTRCLTLLGNVHGLTG